MHCKLVHFAKKRHMPECNQLVKHTHSIERNAEIVLLFLCFHFGCVMFIFLIVLFGLRTQIDLNYVIMRTYWSVATVLKAHTFSVQYFFSSVSLILLTAFHCVYARSASGQSDEGTDWSWFWIHLKKKKLNKLTTSRNLIDFIFLFLFYFISSVVL